VLADQDDALMAAYLDDGTPLPYRRLRDELAAQTRRALVHPVYFGSAITGAGVDALISGITELLPASERDTEGAVSGTVFKIERGPAGEKIAFVRMVSGTVRTRDKLTFGRDGEAGEGKVTAISVFDQGAAVSRGSVEAGRIGLLRGLGDIRIGDTIGDAMDAVDAVDAEDSIDTGDSIGASQTQVPSGAAPPTRARCTRRSPNSSSRTR
jgi:ribosomal protection tetracycline resistance protein